MFCGVCIVASAVFFLTDRQGIQLISRQTEKKLWVQPWTQTRNLQTYIEIGLSAVKSIRLLSPTRRHYRKAVPTPIRIYNTLQHARPATSAKIQLVMYELNHNDRTP